MSNIYLPTIFSPITARFEDPMGLLRPLWRDYSIYQGFVNHEVAAAEGVLGMVARATISWGYQDAQFKNNYIGAGLVGMYRSSYHVIYPGQPVMRQLDNWYGVHPEIDIIPRVLDLELEHDQTPTRIADVTWHMSEIILARDGQRPIIYSRYLLLDKWLKSWTDMMLNSHYWWLAQYLWDRTREHPGPPTLPNRITEDRIILHQTADKKPPYKGEVQSRTVDWDRWEIGGELNMNQWIENHWGGQVTPPKPRIDWYTDIDALARSQGIDPEPLPPPAHTHAPAE